MTIDKAAGFWSYTHRDNEADGGRLLRLAQRVQEEYELLTGSELTIFVDRKDLSWGDEWSARINEALQSTTFLIAIITPRFLQSPPCRREVLTFTGKAESLGLNELFLPIVYVPIKQLSEEESSDEIIDLVSRTQYMDWINLRLLDEESAEYREAVNSLATRLMEIAERLESHPPELPSAGELARIEESADEPGLLDIMVEAEETFPAWADTLAELFELLKQLHEAVVPVGGRLEESNRKGKGFAGRLLLLRELAGEIDPIADRMVDLSSQYAEQVVRLNPAMQAALEQLNQDSDGSTPEQRAAFVETMKEFGANVSGIVSGIEQLGEGLTQAQRLSRDLARPSRKMKGALVSLLDSHTLIDEWVTGFEQRG